MEKRNIKRAQDIIGKIESLEFDIKRAKEISDQDSVYIVACFGSNQQFRVNNAKPQIRALAKIFIKNCEDEIKALEQELETL